MSESRTIIKKSKKLNCERSSTGDLEQNEKVFKGLF